MANQEAVDRTMRHIQDHMDAFDMCEWGGKWADNSCGTSACFAGHAAMAAGWTPLGNMAYAKDGTVRDASTIARHELRLTAGEAIAIFYATGITSYEELAAHIKEVLK